MVDNYKGILLGGDIGNRVGENKMCEGILWFCEKVSDLKMGLNEGFLKGSDGWGGNRRK